MEILELVKHYWVMITFFIGEIAVVWTFIKSVLEGIKCTLRNDILDIYDRSKDRQKITRYQLQSIKYSYDVYKKLKGTERDNAVHQMRIDIHRAIKKDLGI